MTRPDFNRCYFLGFEKRSGNSGNRTRGEKAGTIRAAIYNSRKIIRVDLDVCRIVVCSKRLAGQAPLPNLFDSRHIVS